MADPTVLDVRPLPPREKHSSIFSLFDSLASGESMILVNDHDPVPLRYQFNIERGDKFVWTPLQEGPDEWRIDIRKA